LLGWRGLIESVRVTDVAHSALIEQMKDSGTLTCAGRPPVQLRQHHGLAQAVEGFGAGLNLSRKVSFGPRG
jgi:hypothetical protein